MENCKNKVLNNLIKYTGEFAEEKCVFTYMFKLTFFSLQAFWPKAVMLSRYVTTPPRHCPKIDVKRYICEVANSLIRCSPHICGALLLTRAVRNYYTELFVPGSWMILQVGLT